MTAVSSNASAASAYPTNSADTAPAEETSAAAAAEAAEGVEETAATAAAELEAAAEDSFETAAPSAAAIKGPQTADKNAADLAANSELNSFQINPATGMPNQSVQMMDKSASAQSEKGSVEANVQAGLEVQDNIADPDTIEGATVSGQVNAERQVGNAQVNARAKATADTNGNIDAAAQVDVRTDSTQAAVYAETDGQSASVIAAAQYNGDNLDLNGGIRADTEGNVDGEIHADFNAADGQLTGEVDGEFDNSGASGQVKVDYDGDNVDAHLYAQGDTRSGDYDIEADFQAQNDDGSLRAEGTFRADENGYEAQVDGTYENGDAQYAAGMHADKDGASAYASAEVDRGAVRGAADVAIDKDGVDVHGEVAVENKSGTLGVEAQVDAEFPFNDERLNLDVSANAYADIGRVKVEAGVQKQAGGPVAPRAGIRVRF